MSHSYPIPSSSAMPSSSTTSSAPIRRRGFVDGHLTLQQKHEFWSRRVNIATRGKQYSGSRLELVEFSELALVLADEYDEHTRAYRPTNGPKSASTMTHGAHDTIIGDLTTDLILLQPVRTCMCGGLVFYDEDTFCQNCWFYFVLITTKGKFLQDREAVLRAPTGMMQALPTNQPRRAPQGFTPSANPGSSSPLPHASRLAIPQTYPTNQPSSSYPVQGPRTAMLPPQYSQEPIDLCSPEGDSPSTPRKPAKTPLPQASCIKCKRTFPVNLTKNDGVHCTQCCNKAKRESEKGSASPAVGPSNITPQMPGVSLEGASQKRKAESVGGKEPVVAASANKKPKTDDVAKPKLITPEESLSLDFSVEGAERLLRERQQQ